MPPHPQVQSSRSRSDNGVVGSLSTVRRRRMSAAAGAAIVAAALGASIVTAPVGAAPVAANANPARQASGTSVSGTVPGTNCPLFPANNYWRTPIRDAKVHRRSKRWVRAIGGGKLHPDFGPSFGEQAIPYGIPFNVVRNAHVTARVTFDYDDESDHVRYPLGSDIVLEGGPGADGDRHAIIVNADTCTLYETWATERRGSRWHAGSGAVWDLRSNALRPREWTSADAAGLPILPGLLRYDEVRAGKVKHAIRFTAPVTRDRFIWPARHRAGATDSAGYPPMGARFRLKKSFSLVGWSRDARVVLKAMKRFGLVLADNGAAWYFQGTSDERWPVALVSELKQIPARSFVAVATAGMKIRPWSGRARRP